MAALQPDRHPGLPYAALKRLFDYYLSTLGERDLAVIVQQLQQELAQQLLAAQLSAARRLLDLYLAYQADLVNLEPTPGSGVAALRLRAQAVQAVRARYFSTEEVQALFGLDDAYDDYALARLQVAETPGLSAAQRQAQWAALDEALPSALRAQRDADLVVVQLDQRVQQARAAGASDDAVYRLRAQAVGVPAADRLAALDRQEAQWQARVQSYLQARATAGRLGRRRRARDGTGATAGTALQRRGARAADRLRTAVKAQRARAEAPAPAARLPWGRLDRRANMRRQ